MKSTLATTPSPPYWACIFTSLRSDGDNGYAMMAERMEALAKRQPGFLGIESAREGLGITVSYWASQESMKEWKAQIEHLGAQALGRKTWYTSYRVRIGRVEREYGPEG